MIKNLCTSNFPIVTTIVLCTIQRSKDTFPTMNRQQQISEFSVILKEVKGLNLYYREDVCKAFGTKDVHAVWYFSLTKS